jgi:hypothetical protein
MSDSGSVFSKLISEEPKKESEPEKILRGPLLRPVVPPTDRFSSPVEQLLSWLMRWPKPTVTTKNILQFGPNCLRNRKSARPAAETLVEWGWLTPLKTRCYREREWRIERGPSESR